MKLSRAALALAFASESRWPPSAQQITGAGSTFGAPGLCQVG